MRIYKIMMSRFFVDGIDYSNELIGLTFVEQDPPRVMAIGSQAPTWNDEKGRYEHNTGIANIKLFDPENYLFVTPVQLATACEQQGRSEALQMYFAHLPTDIIRIPKDACTRVQ